MQRIMNCLLVATGIAGLGAGQTFEVASVRISEPFRQGTEGSRRGDIKTTPDTVTMRDIGLTSVIIWAYNISPYQIANAPGRDSERYDIVAKAAAPATVDVMRRMMQALLLERFKLSVHRETRQLSAYALVEAKGGHKLLKADLVEGAGIESDPGTWILRGKATTLDRLAMYLSDPLRMPVTDMTGLKGRYNFILDITDFVPRQPVAGEPPPDPVAIFQAALPKQLGLKLEARRLPVEIVVIDHFDKVPVEQ
jgi:uncharacterized protein (TIGR03435 family)